MVNPNPPTEQLRNYNGRKTLKAEQALKAELNAGGLTECGAYRKMREIWRAQIEKAIDGNTESAKLIIERLDGKPKQQIDTNINVNVAFEQALIDGRTRAIQQSKNQSLITDQESPIIEGEVIDQNVLNPEKT